MGKWLMGIVVALMAGVMVATDAEARRLAERSLAPA